MAHYAKVFNGKVVSVIAADSPQLKSFDGSSYKYQGSLHTQDVAVYEIARSRTRKLT